MLRFRPSLQAVIIVDDDYLVSMRLQNKLHQCGLRDTTSKWSTLFYTPLQARRQCRIRL